MINACQRVSLPNPPPCRAVHVVPAAAAPAPGPLSHCFSCPRASGPACPLSRASRTAPAQIPITTPPRMARQLHSKPMKMGLAPLPFSHSQAACLLLPTSLVVDDHAPRLGHACRFSARTLHAALPAANGKLGPASVSDAAAALPPLRCHSSQRCRILLSYSLPPRIEADYSIKR